MKNLKTTGEFPTVASLFMLAGIALVGLMAGAFVGALLAKAIYGIEGSDLIVLTTTPQSILNGREALFWMQGASALFGFFLFPYLFQKFIDRLPLSYIAQPLNKPLAAYAIIALMVLVIQPFILYFSMLNQSLPFPDAFAKWAMEKETQAAELTKFLLDFHGIGQFLGALLVIAVIAGWAEEYFFRGLLQPKINKLIHNPHIAIWITAFIFSAIHVQFYGFLPRMLLGGLFGYVFYWTGNIVLAGFGHFINNGSAIVFSFLYQQNYISTSPDTLEQQVNPLVALLSFVGAAGLLVLFYKTQSQNNTPLDISEGLTISSRK